MKWNKNALWPALGFLFAVFAHGAEPGTIKKIDFLPGKERAVLALHFNGAGRFRVFQSEKQGSVVVEAENLSLPANLTKVIDGGSASGPVLQVTPYSASGARAMAKIVLQLRGRADVVSSETPGKFTVELTKKKLPISAVAAGGKKVVGTDVVKNQDSATEKSEETARKLVEVLNAPAEDKRYFGTKVTFEGNGVDVHDIFRLVGEASDLNIISDGDVKYSSNYSLKDIPWDQLLDIVFQQAQLKAAVNGNVVRIYTLKTYTEEQATRAQDVGMADRMEPVIMAVIPLSFATAEDMSKMIDSLLVKRDQASTATPAAGAAAQNVTSNDPSAAGSRSAAPRQDFVRGEVQVDTRSNSLIITNTKETIERVRRLVKELDVPLPQVLIDAKIVIATESFAQSVGVSWSGKTTTSGTGRAGTAGGFNTNGIDITPGSAPFAISPTAGSADGGASGAIGFQVGTGMHGNLSAQLALAEANQVGKTIASPRVIVNNKKTATITDGTTLLRSTTPGANTTGTIDRISASLNLTVTPQVTSAGSVQMDLNITKDTPSGSDILNKAMTTQVLVDSGSTLVLGGVYQFDQTRDEFGIPLLKDLPFIGQLFRTNRSSDTKSELMVFVTPQILEASESGLQNGASL